MQDDGREAARRAAMEGPARRDNYRSGSILAKRQAVFGYVDPGRSSGLEPLELLDWSGRERVLDAGCGNGMWMRALDEKFSVHDVTGLDLSVGMLGDARTTVGNQVGLVSGDVQSLPFTNSSFDVVLSFWMLYHVPDLAGAVGELHRVLRPGGQLLATTNSNRSRALDDVFAAALSVVTGTDVDWPPGFSFSVENGQTLLQPVFEEVRSEPRVTAFAVPEPAPLLDVLDSIRGPVEAYLGSSVDWAAVRSEAQAVIEGVIAREGTFRNEMVSCTFVATKAMQQ